MDNDSTRDRVRALVREVLAKTAPEPAAGETQPIQFVNTVPEASTQTAVTRDESAKSVITEDDVRGLEPGAVLRIGEDARLTPLAADIQKQAVRSAGLANRGVVHADFYVLHWTRMPASCAV